MIKLTPEEYQKLFELPPKKAIAFLKSKGIILTKTWNEIEAEAHQTAFTVAGVFSAELLETFKKYVEEALEQGWSQQEFKANFLPAMEAAGWLPSPTKKGIASRIELIYRTNLQSAFNKGRFDQMTENGAVYIQYLVIDDSVTTDICKQLKNKVVRADDPALRIPPFHYNCRTRIRSVPERILRRQGYEVETMQEAQGQATVAENFNRDPRKAYAPDADKYDTNVQQALDKYLAEVE